MIIPRKLLQWTIGKKSRRIALLNNFGAAGSNAALILEEHQEAKPEGDLTKICSSHVLNLSAKSINAMEYLREKFIALIDAPPNDLNLPSLCYSANARKTEHHPYRISVTGKSLNELSVQLRQAQVIQSSTKSPTRKTVFVFSGQGAMRSGVGAELLKTSPVYSSVVLRCDKLLSSNGFPSVLSYLSGSLSAFETLDLSDQIILSQCSCYVLEYALARTWISWGLVPDLVVGHR